MRVGGEDAYLRAGYDLAMARPPKPPLRFVNWRGEAIDLSDLIPAGRKASAHVPPPAPEPASAPVLAPADLDTVWDVLCLAGCARGKTWLLQFLRALERRTAQDKAFDAGQVSAALAALERADRVSTDQAGRYLVPGPARDTALGRVMAAPWAAKSWEAWARASSSYPSAGRELPRPGFQRREEIVALARLLVYGGLKLEEFEDLRRHLMAQHAPLMVLAEALTQPFLPAMWDRAEPELRDALLSGLLHAEHLQSTGLAALLDWLDRRVAQQPREMSAPLRYLVAERRMHRADAAGAEQALREVGGPAVLLLRAALPVFKGEWAGVAATAPELLKQAAKDSGSKRSFAGPRVLHWLVLALLAGQDPKQWTVAHKLCVAESGSRKPNALEHWGLWAHAIAMRLGDAALLPLAFEGPRSEWQERDFETNAHRLILAAWLGLTPMHWPPKILKLTLDGLVDAGLTALAALTQVAIDRLGLKAAPAASSVASAATDAGAAAAAIASAAMPPTAWAQAFFGAPREAWRDALAAIEALGTNSARPAAELADARPLQWRLSLDKYGRVLRVEPYETTPGVRGPGKPKRVPLLRLKKSERLSPIDAAVVRCLNAPRWAPSKLRLDTTSATQALVGHPGVVFDDAPAQTVDLREGLPQLEVLRQKAPDGVEHFVFHLADTIATPATAVDLDSEFEDVPAERERRNGLRVMRDAVDRARVLRLNPAQRRVAELVGQKWAVPVDAKAELDAALKVLAGHFQLHSDATAGQEVASDNRLRAQLSPQGDGLQLRLLVQPFGAFGPMVEPGHGRERLLALHEGLNLATRRDLAAEAAQLEAVLDALPALAGAEAGDSTWLLADPEQALAVLEQLPRLPAIGSVDWPRGKPVRVQPVAAQALQLRVKTGTDWLGLQGELQLEEGRVLSLQRLLQLAHESRRGRFIALGEGDYLALTDQLKRQLADLNALAQAEGAGIKLPASAAAWLAETLEDGTLQGDKHWHTRLKRLDEAAALQPQIPAGLQAELRSYQAEGVAWMVRLAHAGWGACLADDMGLGKTVQTLALLLYRADIGPALVLAPTSVCSNWVDEAARFAPGLRVQLYGEGERAAMLQGLGAGDVLVASYALAQIDADAFAAVPWASLVLDEAQALKNAATKRAKAVAALQADFRLALTGTPVENRLADLWSIMNLLNPGLLGSQARFAEKFANPIERDRDDAARLRLRRLVSPFLLRRTKAQVLSDLPPRTEIIHRIEPGPEERAFLEASRRAALERIANAADAPPGQAAFNVLAELTRLRRAACDPRLVAPELGLVGAKVHEFEQLASELVAGRHKALVFSQFTDFLKLLGERLDSLGLKYQYLDGSTPAAERGKRVAAFQRGEGDLFLISLKAGGFGLNLTAADYVLIVDPWWNPAAEDQALGRAHRMGQQRPVTVYRLVTAGSVEERIVALHRDKRKLADGILDEQDNSAPLAAADLRDLLRAD